MHSVKAFKWYQVFANQKNIKEITTTKILNFGGL